jgi:hypothetical protein
LLNRYIKVVKQTEMSIATDYGDIKNPEMLWDLRLTYATELLAPILREIEIARTENNFMKWYELLTMNLHTNINQKLTTDEREEYETEHQKVLKVINEFPTVFKGTDKSPPTLYKLKIALKNFEMWLRDKMEDHGLFGRIAVYDEDEI